jgi:hypothetical protein
VEKNVVVLREDGAPWAAEGAAGIAGYAPGGGQPSSMSTSSVRNLDAIGEDMTGRRPSPRTLSAAAPLAVLAALSAACSTSGSSSASTATTTSSSMPVSPTTAPSTTAGGVVPATGVYADGATGTPHYLLDVTAVSGSTMSGTLEFVFQDGRTQTVWTFTGTVHDGSATLTTSPGGKTISLTYTTSSIVLASCTAYLQYAQSDSQCTFTRSSPGT